MIFHSFLEDKYVRMHLKGRPVPLYAPTNIEDDGPYDVKGEQGPPQQTLKLEWVYPSAVRPVARVLCWLQRSG